MRYLISYMTLALFAIAIANPHVCGVPLPEKQVSDLSSVEQQWPRHASSDGFKQEQDNGNEPAALDGPAAFKEQHFAFDEPADPGATSAFTIRGSLPMTMHGGNPGAAPQLRDGPRCDPCKDKNCPGLNLALDFCGGGSHGHGHP